MKKEITSIESVKQAIDFIKSYEKIRYLIHDFLGEFTEYMNWEEYQKAYDMLLKAQKLTFRTRIRLIKFITLKSDSHITTALKNESKKRKELSSLKWKTSNDIIDDFKKSEKTG